MAGDLYLECDNPGSPDEPSVGSTCQQQASDELDPQDGEEQETMSQLPESYIEEESNFTSCLKSDLEYTTEKVALQFLPGIYGCGAEKHDDSLRMHIQDVGPAKHHTLNELRLKNVPHTLDKPDFTPS
jgi:hypothetical protein